MRKTVKIFYDKILSRPVIKNFSILSIANILAQASFLLASIRLAPLLGPAGYGYYNIIIVLASIFAIISTFGMRTIIIRSIARSPNHTRSYFLKTVTLRSFFLVCSFLVFILYNTVVDKDMKDTFSIIAVMILVTTTTLWDTVESVSFGNQIMKISAFIELAAAIVWTGSIYIVPDNLFDVKLILVIHIGIQIIKNAAYLSWLLASNVLKKKQPLDIPADSLNIIVKYSSSYFLLAVFTCMQNLFPLIFLERNTNLAQVGIFNVGYRILAPLQMLITVALTALFPNMSVLSFKNPTSFYEKCKKGIFFVMLTGITGCLLFTIFSEEIVLLLYGESFKQSARVISLQCWYVIFYGIFSFIGTVWSASNMQKRLAVISGIGTCIALPVLWIGSKYGSEGLALSFIISSMINMSYHWYLFASKTFVQRISLKESMTYWTIFIIYMIISISIPQELNVWYKLGIMLFILSPIFFYLYGKRKIYSQI